MLLLRPVEVSELGRLHMPCCYGRLHCVPGKGWEGKWGERGEELTLCDSFQSGEV